MQEDEFLTAIQRRTNLESADETRAAVTATLETLGERITVGEAENIASQLPSEFAEPLQENTTEEADTFTADEFIARVRERETRTSGVDSSNAVQHIQAITTELGAAVSGGELQDAFDQLPEGYERLFEPIDTSEEQL